MDNIAELLEILETLRSKLAEKPQDLDLLDQYFDTVVPKFGEALKNANSGEGSGLNPAYQLLSSFLAELNLYQVSDEPDLRNDSIDRLGLLLEQAQVLSLLPSVEAPRSPSSHRREKSEGKRQSRRQSSQPGQSKELKTSGGEQAAAAELRREKRESKEAPKEREPKTEKKMKRSSTHPKPSRGEKDEGQKVARQSSSKNLAKSRVASTSDPDANGAEPKDAPVKESSTKDTLAKTKDTDRKETDRRENDRKEAERKEAERRELERRESERKDTERRELERREAERRELERREAERRELERRDSERKDTERRDRDTPPSPIKETQKERYGTLKKVHSRSRGKLRVIHQPNAKFGLEVELGEEDATDGTLTNVENSLAQDPERAAIMSSTDGAHQPSPQRISSDVQSAPHSPHRPSLVPRSLAHVALQESIMEDVAESTTQSISTSRGVFLPSTTSSDDFQPRLRTQGSVRALAAKFESSGGTPSAIPRRLSASPGSFTDRSQPSMLPKSAALKSFKSNYDNPPPRPASFNGTTKHALTANAFRAGTLGGKSFAAPQNVVSLQFTVVLAKELATIHTQTSDPYVKVFFYQNHTSEPQLIMKTPKLKNTCNPNWGDSFEDKSLISDTVSFRNPSNYVLFTIWDWEKVLVHKSLGECKLHYDDVVQLLEKHTAAEGNNPNKVASLTIRLPLTLGKKTNYKACLELNLTISRGYLSTIALSINNPTKKMEPALIKKNDSTPAPKKEKPEKVDTGPKDYSKLFEAGKKDLVEDMMKLVQRYSPNVQEEVMPLLRGDFTDLLNTFHEKLQNDGKLGKLPNDRIADLPLHAIMHQIDFANSNLEFEFLSNFVQFFNSTIGFYETISDCEIFVKPVNMHEVKSSSNKVLTGLVTLLLKIKGAVVPELMVTHTKISTTLKNHLTKMMINPHIEKFDLSKYVGTQQMRYIAYKFKLTLLLKLNRLAGVVTNILTSNLVQHKECVVSTITLCDTFLSEVLLCLTIAETLHWVYTTELESKCKKSSTTTNLKLDLEGALASYTGQLVESSTAIQPFKEVEHFFIAMLLSQAHSDSKNAMHCLLEAHANNNAKVVWLLIEQAWNMALTFEREFRISKYIVYSRLGLLLQLFLVKFRDYMSQTLLVKIEKFAKTNFDLLGSQSAAVMEELSKPLLTVPEQFTQRIDVESIKVWYIEPVRYSNMIIHYNSYEVAQQLTIVDFELYHSITHRELSHLKWDKPQETIICNNVIVNIRRINQVAQWVATNVISSETKSERADMLRHFVNIASHLLKIKNFASFIGVMSGLNIASLTRLKETMALFEKTYPEAQQEFETLMYLEDPTGSFAKLRERVTNSGTQIIPYIGTCLADLTLSDEGNPDTVSVDNVECVNYPKYQLISNTIKKFLYFQNVSEVSYRFQVEEPLYSKMMSLPSLDDARLYELSLVREPRVQSS